MSPGRGIARAAARGERPRIMVIYQHGTGIGHASRAEALAVAMRGEAEVTLVSGGVPIPGREPPEGVGFVQLDPIAWEYRYGADPRSASREPDFAATSRRRGAQVLAAVRTTRPDAIVFEFYPFAPHRFGGACDPLMRHLPSMKAPPLCFCSLRSRLATLVEGGRAEYGQAREMLASRFAAVLHHVDPRVFPPDTMPADVLQAMGGVPLHRTGFVRRRAAPRAEAPAPRGGLLLCVGGGSNEGAEWLHRVLDALPLMRQRSVPVRAVCGPMMPAEAQTGLMARAGEGVEIIERARDLEGAIAASDVVVSFAGYNATVEALAQGKPLLLTPKSAFAYEQAENAQAFSDAGLALSLPREAAPAEIAAALDRVLGFRPAFIPDCNGARVSADLVMGMIRQRRAALRST
jgi:predicted glycosyltransferase